MKYRLSQLLAAEDITTAGTKTISLDVRDPISRLMIGVVLTNSNYVPIGHPSAVISKIELVDGSDVLFSMRGCYAMATSFYGTKMIPYCFNQYISGSKPKVWIPIDFGRYLWDPELALVPDRFRNLQLKITHNYALGGCTTSAATMEVWADLFDEKVVSPMGFLMSKSHWSKTLVASTPSYVELPTDHPIRLLMPAAFSNDEEPDVNIDSLKLTEEHDKRVLLDAGVAELLKQYEALWPMYEESGQGRCIAGTNEEFFFMCQKDLMLSAFPNEDADTYINFPWSGGNARNIMGSAGTTIDIHVKGRCPAGVIPIPMGQLNEIDDWWDVTNLGSARLKMVTGAGDTSALYELLIQQLRRY